MSRFGILGGGFGLYGYLPAVQSLGFKPLLPLRYRELVLRRSEIEHLNSSIEYYEDETELIRDAEYIVVARTPFHQYDLIENHHDLLSEKKYVFLEKPLADSSLHYSQVLKRLDENKIKFSVGYLFRYTVWYRNLLSTLSSKSDKFQIVWRIPKVNSPWKNDSSLGGGALKFYGIHLLCLLLDIGILEKNIVTYEDDSSFQIITSDDLSHEFRGLLVNENPSFKVTNQVNGEVIFSDCTPFGPKPKLGNPDPRVNFIRQYISDELSSEHDFKAKIIIEQKLNSLINNPIDLATLNPLLK